LINSQEGSRAYAERAPEEVSAELRTDSVYSLAPQMVHRKTQWKKMGRGYLDVSVLRTTRAHGVVDAVGAVQDVDDVELGKMH
jgi:hypothetical protein